MATLSRYVHYNNVHVPISVHTSDSKNTTMNTFEWEIALKNFNTLEEVTSPRIRQMVRNLPRELLLYFEGNPVHNSFAHFFNVDTDKIYAQKASHTSLLSQTAFALMGMAVVLVSIGLALNYSSFMVSLLP